MNFLDQDCRAKMVARTWKRALQLKWLERWLDKRKEEKKDSCSCVHKTLLLVLNRPTLCSPMDCSSPGTSVHGILQARILKWVAISSSRASS